MSPSKPNNLATLPTELLYQILTIPTLTHLDLLHLILTNKNLQTLISPQLYQAITFTSTSFYDDQPSRRKLFSLSQAVKNPSFGPLVQTFNLTLNDCNVSLNDWERVTSILSHMPNLEVLDLTVTSSIRGQYPHRDHYRSAQYNLLPEDGLRELRVLKYTVSEDWTNAIIPAMSLPKIETLVLPRIYKYEYWRETTKFLSKDIKSTIKELDLGSTVICPALEEILKWPEALEKFSCSFGDSYCALRCWERFQGFSLQTILNVQKESLREVHLGRSYDLGIPREKMDFSAFERLEYLEIMSELVFPFGIQDLGDGRKSRKGVYKRLPGALRVLKITFGPKSRRLRELYDLKFEFKIDGHFEWIEELALHKPERLPNLQVVTLEEHSSAYHHNSWPGLKHNHDKVQEWDMPSSLKELFESKRILLGVTVRKP